MSIIKEEWKKAISVMLLFKNGHLGIIIENSNSEEKGIIILERDIVEENKEYYMNCLDDYLYLLPDRGCRILEFYIDNTFEGILRSLDADYDGLNKTAAECPKFTSFSHMKYSHN